MLPKAPMPSPSLTPDNQIGYRKILEIHEQAEKDCLAVTDNKLTQEEFRKASTEFQILVGNPFREGKPIYILPEKNDKKQLRRELQTLKTAIEQGRPYHEFITQSYGALWPSLLRLFYGLECGFRISIEQFHAMLKISYWRSIGQPMESISLFDQDNPLVPSFYQRLLFPIDAEEKQRFMQSFLLNPEIPKAEKSIFVLKLNDDYLRIVAMRRVSKVSHLARLKEQRLGRVEPSPREASDAMQQGREMFAVLTEDAIWPYGTAVMGTDVFISLPSPTFMKYYAHMINPNRTVKYVRRLGPISPELLEYHSDRNERVGNLVAPGIKWPINVHRKPTHPALAVEHDDYHFDYESTITPEIYQQFQHLKTMLRKIISADQSLLTKEIMRCIDREVSPRQTEHLRFLMLLKCVFTAEDEELRKDNPILGVSSTLALVDMILHPECWPFYKPLKQEIIPILFQCKTATPKPEELERLVKTYSEICKENYSMITWLLLCRYYLNDNLLCSAILDRLRYDAMMTTLSWEKAETKNILPVVHTGDTKILFADILAMTPQDRVKCIAPWKFTKYFLPANSRLTKGELLSHTRSCNVQPIIHLDPSEKWVVAIELPTCLLLKTIREPLGLDRIRAIDGLTSVQQKYLQSKIPTIGIEPDPDNKNAVLCTFPRTERTLVEKVINHWNVIEKAAVTIQKIWRSHQQAKTNIDTHNSAPAPTSLKWETSLGGC